MLARILLLVAALSMPGALRAEQTETEKAGFESRLTIYLAKGAPDACGPGCDRWIAIEGEVDQDAGPRIRRFLAGVKDMQRPIYLHSPGGNVEQSYVIGRLLRSRKAVARVGRTIATACAPRPQVGAPSPENQAPRRRGQAGAPTPQAQVQLGPRLLFSRAAIHP